MNAERLHAIAIAIEKDLSETQFLNLLQQLIQTIVNLIQQPNNAQFQNQVAQQREEVIQALRRSRFNDFSPAWRQVVGEIGGDIFFDNLLEKKINELFSANQITPAALNSSLQKILADAQGWLEGIKQLNAGFSRLEIGKEDLSPGESELGTLIPRAFVGDRLDRFATELSRLNKMFGVFSEISTGSRPGFKIRTISSSDLTVFLDAAPTVCACIAVAIERIVALYKNMLEIRKLQGELKKQGIKDDQLKGVQDHVENSMSEGIDRLADDIIAKFSVVEHEGRKNELAIELRMTLKNLAARIDRGFNIEVRMAIPSPSKQDSGDNEAMSNFETIKEATPNMQFLKLSGDPILKLPNGEADLESSAPSVTTD